MDLLQMTQQKYYILMKLLRYKLLTPFLMVLLMANPCFSISPTKPILVNPNTQNSPTNFIFYFMLQKNLPPTDYLMIVFSPFSTNVIPLECILLDSGAVAVTNCVDLQTGTDLTIQSSQIYEFNPNIDPTITVVAQFSHELIANQEYTLQVLTDNVLPNIGSITSNFELYTITDTAVMQEENWNFGTVFLEPRQNKVLSILNKNSMTQNLPGQSFTNLNFQITIGQQTPTPRSRFKFIISDDFKFTDSSLVTTGSIINSPPAIISSEIISPNIIITTFNQSFTVGRKFSIKIADYLNPLKIASGWISVYHLPQNSMSPLEISEQSIPITTIPFDLTLTILTIDRTVPSAPIQMYTSTDQYLTLDILLPRKVESNFIIKVQSDLLVVHEGSVYFKASTVQMQEVKYEYLDDKTFIISGFPEIPTGSLLSITMEASYPSSDKIKFYVSIDVQSQINNPILYKQIISVAAAIPGTFITALTGNSAQPNILTSMKSISESKISFSVTPNFDTNDGSSLSLIGPAKLRNTTNFNPASSCLVNSIAKPCTIVIGTTYTNITIASHSSENLFPKAGSQNIQINNLKFDRTSSHTQGGVYHLYFSMRVSQAVDASLKNLLKKVVVLPERQQMTNFGLFFSNNLKFMSANYPNVVRLVSSSSSSWLYTVQIYERRMISIYAKEGWTNLFTDLNNGEAYPANSNINGLTYTLYKGSTTTLTEQNPLDWDRIDVILNGDEASIDFSLIFPTTFVDNSVVFEVFAGIYNINTRSIKYVEIENQINMNPAGILLTSKPKITTNKIQLKGAAGSLKNKIQTTITTGTGTYDGSTYSAALMTVSDWQYFEDLSTFSTISLNSTSPIFRLVEQTPLMIYLPNNGKYLTYIPLSTSPAPNIASFSMFLDNVQLPYSHDLPYYSIYLIDYSGTIDSYNQFINQDKSVFYESYFRSLSFSCAVNSLGISNTYCTIIFNNTMKIPEKAMVEVYFTGMDISTDMCQMRDAINDIDIPIDCSSNVNKNRLTINLKNSERFAELLHFQIKIFGVSIKNNTNIHYISVELRDSTGSYIIEHGQRILMTKVQVFNSIIIYQVSYTKNNPIVYSNFFLRFHLPRSLNEDELLGLVMSKDLLNLNTIQSKLNIVLKDSGGVEIPLIWKLSLKNFMITFEDLVSVLAQSNYTLNIYGIKTPSTIQQDLISIIYLRKYDSAYTVSNNANSTAEFPSLTSKVDSKITLTTKLNTEGLQHQLNFLIINQYALVTVNTTWIINFPRYYSQRLWNHPEYQKYCTIDGIFIQCEIDYDTPYQLIIKNSPRTIQIGDTYEINVYGIACPRKNYLNGAADYVTESIFLGVSENSSSQSYVQYSQLFVTDTVITIQGTVGYGDIIVKGVSSSNMEVLQNTFFVLTLQSTQDINLNQYIFIIFPKQFDNFNDLPLTCLVRQNSNDQAYQASVVNRRIGFQLTSMTLLANTEFDIQISSLATPSSPCVIDMNQIQIIVASGSLQTTSAASLQRHNLVSTMQFTPSGLHIVINNYKIIEVTAGTYSNQIAIEPSTFTTFSSNMKISFVSNYLKFDPSPVYAYLGEEKAIFKIGADLNLIPKLYTYEIIKSETSISAVYASLSKYLVSVTNNPILITIPSAINVPIGGCSVPYLIKLTNIPYDSIQLNFQYDTSLFNLQLFWINQQISYNTLQFSNGIVERWLSFCSSPSLNSQSFIAESYISGLNQKAYDLSSETININLVSNSTTNKNPEVSIVKKNIQKTYAGFQVTTNLNGQIFYELKVNGISSPLSIIDLKSSIKEGVDLVLESQNFDRIYTQDKDHRIGIKNILVGTSPLEFQNLLPERNYEVCVIFQNQHRTATSRKCIQFSTMSWGKVIKASLQFNGTVYSNQLNKMLCFFVRASSSQINQIVNLDGHSCSLSNIPENYNYLYKGQTQTDELTSTLVYFITNKNLTTDPSENLFKSIYNSSSPYEITSSSLAQALSSFSINYINTSKYITEFDAISALKGEITTLTAELGEPKFDEATETLTLNQITLSEAGTLYFILVFNKRIIKNQISNHYDIQIQQTVNPTPQQIFNCQDFSGNPPLSCQRITLINGATKSLLFSKIKSGSIYRIYYVITNQYPLRPIAVGQVKNITVDTSSSQFNLFSHILVVVCLMLVFVL